MNTNLVRKFVHDEFANTAIEYAMLLTVLAAAIAPLTYSIGSAVAAKLAPLAGITLTIAEYGG